MSERWWDCVEVAASLGGGGSPKLGGLPKRRPLSQTPKPSADLIVFTRNQKGHTVRSTWCWYSLHPLLQPSKMHAVRHKPHVGTIFSAECEILYSCMHLERQTSSIPDPIQTLLVDLQGPPASKQVPKLAPAAPAEAELHYDVSIARLFCGAD